VLYSVCLLMANKWMMMLIGYAAACVCALRAAVSVRL